jgi:hypothetical protein
MILGHRDPIRGEGLLFAYGPESTIDHPEVLGEPSPAEVVHHCGQSRGLGGHRLTPDPR